MTTVSREELLVRLSDGLRAADRLNIALIAHMARRFPNDVPSADVEKAMVEWETSRDKLPSYDECQRLADKPADDGVREALKPFAKIADDYDRADALRHSHYADEGRPAGPPYPDSHRVSIGLGDCRKARDALSTKAKP